MYDDRYDVDIRMEEDTRYADDTRTAEMSREYIEKNREAYGELRNTSEFDRAMGAADKDRERFNDTSFDRHEDDRYYFRTDDRDDARSASLRDELNRECDELYMRAEEAAGPKADREMIDDMYMRMQFTKDPDELRAIEREGYY